MQREGAGYWRRRAIGQWIDIQQALLQHVSRSAVALLARLKHKQHPAGQLAAMCREHLCCTDQHRCVRVVTTCVHAPIYLRTEIEIGVFGHGQRIHIAAQQDGWTRLSAGEHRADSRGTRVQFEIEWQALER